MVPRLLTKTMDQRNQDVPNFPYLRQPFVPKGFLSKVSKAVLKSILFLHSLEIYVASSRVVLNLHVGNICRKRSILCSMVVALQGENTYAAGV